MKLYAQQQAKAMRQLHPLRQHPVKRGSVHRWGGFFGFLDHQNTAAAPAAGADKIHLLVVVRLRDEPVLFILAHDFQGFFYRDGLDTPCYRQLRPFPKAHAGFFTMGFLAGIAPRRCSHPAHASVDDNRVTAIIDYVPDIVIGGDMMLDSNALSQMSGAFISAWT
jgi:hypothetical protein